MRHRIANSSIEDNVKKRDEIRNEIHSEKQKIVNGSGVWLESVDEACFDDLEISEEDQHLMTILERTEQLRTAYGRPAVAQVSQGHTYKFSKLPTRRCPT